MGRKNVNELEMDLIRLKEREARLKEELVQQRKAADIKTKKERTRKLCNFAEIVTKKMGEETKVAVRNLRRDINDELKKMEKASEITEDDLKGALDEAQKIVDDYIKKIDSIVADKEKEIMEV